MAQQAGITSIYHPFWNRAPFQGLTRRHSTPTTVYLPLLVSCDSSHAITRPLTHRPSPAVTRGRITSPGHRRHHRHRGVCAGGTNFWCAVRSGGLEPWENGDCDPCARLLSGGIRSGPSDGMGGLRGVRLGASGDMRMGVHVREVGSCEGGGRCPAYQPFPVGFAN